jgi:hypothetical protein
VTISSEAFEYRDVSKCDNLAPTTRPIGA